MTLVGRPALLVILARISRATGRVVIKLYQEEKCPRGVIANYPYFVRSINKLSVEQLDAKMGESTYMRSIKWYIMHYSTSV